MLWELKQHLNKWGIFKFEHLEMFEGHQLTCKLCDICYMLVVAEHELMEIEGSMASSLNIPSKDDIDPKKSKADEFELAMKSREVKSYERSKNLV